MDARETGPTVLVVDDDRAIVELLGYALEEVGYNVLSAIGTAALALARAEQPTLILLDVMMPEMDGVEMSRLLRADPATARIPIIAMSAHAHLRHAAPHLQADARLEKPFELRQLYALVARWAGANVSSPGSHVTPSAGSRPS